MLTEAQLKELLEKALAGLASEEELRLLATAVKEGDGEAITENITAWLSSHTQSLALPSEETMNRMADAILAADKVAAGPLKGRVFPLWKKIAAAAAVLLVAALAVFYFRPARTAPAAGSTAQATGEPADKTPGNNRAKLILADGRSIVLDTIAAGTLSVQGQTRISKSGDGQVLYANTPEAATANDQPALYNTVIVPRGGQYQLILSDGSKVWLNAASSLHFPVSFTSAERIVQLEGEGYFEVAKESKRPFIVRTQEADVRVLGTHFNVCAYAGEDWKTTLLEGKVAVERKEHSTILLPGNQGLLPAGSSVVQLVSSADIDEAIAWKEGFFQFNNTSVSLIMQQLSRWYDVDIVYKEAAGKGQFNGRINRNIRLSGIVNALKQGGINCTIEQNKLLVYP